MKALINVRILGIGLLWLACGCAKTPPPVTEAEGVVLLDGLPLPHARIEFVPDLAHFGASLNSTATTDDAGKYRLICNHKSQPGAVVAKHWVIVAEIATPIDRGGRDNPDPDTQRKQAELEARLTNRPIPPEYANVGTTPLKVDVTKGQKMYELNLTRTP
jgi:hypothetical protein